MSAGSARRKTAPPSGAEAIKRMGRLALANDRVPLLFPRIGDGKGPRGKGWDRTTAADARKAIKHANGNTNLGVLLGEPSGGLVDADLDCPEARALALTFLPETPARHGRASIREPGHFWYIATPCERTIKYGDPTTRATLVELRGTGGQTVLPPSVYPDDVLEWKSTGAPARVAWADLRSTVAWLAVATMLARHWPTGGARHDATLPLARVFAGFGERRAASILKAIAKAAGDEEWKARGASAKSTLARLRAGKPVQGMRRLREFFPGEVVDRIGEWVEVPDLAALAAGDGAPAKAAAEAPTPRMASSVTAEAVEWLIEGWLLRVGVHLIGGKQGGGKSALLAAMAAALTQGRTIPGIGTAPKSCVLYFASEDDSPTILRPRLEQAGADLRHVALHDRAFDAVAQLEAAMGNVRKAHPRCRRPRVVILDALDSFLRLEDANKNVEVRARLEALREAAYRQRVALIGVKHLTKAGGEAGDIYGVSGASAYTEISRVVWMLARDDVRSTQTETVGLLEVGKNNYAAIRQGIEYAIDAKGFHWRGDTGRRVRDLREESTPRGRDAARKRAFMERLASMSKVRRATLHRLGTELGLGASTVDRYTHELVASGGLKRDGRGRFEVRPLRLPGMQSTPLR